MKRKNILAIVLVILLTVMAMAYMIVNKQKNITDYNESVLIANAEI